MLDVEQHLKDMIQVYNKLASCHDVDTKEYNQTIRKRSAVQKMLEGLRELRKLEAEK